MTETKKKVPSLRFPEFSGEWEEKKFTEIYTFRSTNSYSRDYLNYENGNIKNIHYGDIHVKYQMLFDITKEEVPFINSSVNIERISLDNYCKEKDLVIADASEDYSAIGKAIEIKKIKNEKVVAGLHTILARPDLINLATGFGGYTMQNDNVKLQIKKQAQGIKVLGLSSNRLAEVILFIPSFSEQKKIADFLSTIDERIQLLKEKKKTLEAYKKGVMQQIFSQQLRFKDENGNDYPDWEEKKLGEIADVITDYVAAGSFEDIRNKVQYLNEINYAQLVRTMDLKNNFTSSNFVFLDKESFDYLYRVNLNEECVILPNIGANIGESYFVIPSKLPHKYNVLGPNAILLKSNSNSIRFISHMLQTDSYQKQLKKCVGASGQPKFNKTELRQFIFKLPTSLEQQKIADFLSSIDDKITLCDQQIKQAEQYKKGLLQQMFV